MPADGEPLTPPAPPELPAAPPEALWLLQPGCLAIAAPRSPLCTLASAPVESVASCCTWSPMFFSPSANFAWSSVGSADSFFWTSW